MEMQIKTQYNICSHSLNDYNQGQTTNSNVENQKSYTSFVDMGSSTEYMYNSLAFPQKDKNILTVYFTNSTLGYTRQ